MGTMVIRTWQEPSLQQGFRARITYGLTPGYEQSTVTTADVDEALKVVRQWLTGQARISGTS